MKEELKELITKASLSELLAALDDVCKERNEYRSAYYIARAWESLEDRPSRRFGSS